MLKVLYTLRMLSNIGNWAVCGASAMHCSAVQCTRVYSMCILVLCSVCGVWCVVCGVWCVASAVCCVHVQFFDDRTDGEHIHQTN